MDNCNIAVIHKKDCAQILRHEQTTQIQIIIFFLFSLTSLSRLFHSYRDESIARWGEMGVPRENHLTHPQAELGLSHRLESTPDTAESRSRLDTLNILMARLKKGLGKKVTLLKLIYTSFLSSKMKTHILKAQ